MSYTIPTNVCVIDKLKAHIKIQEPSKFNVVFLDDDFTSMQFVCDSLELYFNKSADQAYECMMEIHITGACTLGTYSKDIAESKIAQIMALGTSEGFSPTIKLVKQ